jgi:flavorubredoxin
MMPFRTVIRGNLEKIKALDIDIIAPSHGPLYDKPDFIMEAYRDWVSGPCKNEVVIAFVSMHQSTQVMVEALIDALAGCCVTVKPFNLSVTDTGKLAIALVDAATLILASPTIHIGLHPVAMYAAALVNALRPKLKYVGFMGSYGWSSKAVEQASALLPNIKAEFFEPILARGLPTSKEFAAIKQLAVQIAEKHKTDGILKWNGANGNV